jgi:hypothetical protein
MSTKETKTQAPGYFLKKKEEGRNRKEEEKEK